MIWYGMVTKSPTIVIFNGVVWCDVRSHVMNGVVVVLLLMLLVVLMFVRCLLCSRWGAQLQVCPNWEERGGAGGYEGVPLRPRRLLRRQGRGKGRRRVAGAWLVLAHVLGKYHVCDEAVACLSDVFNVNVYMYVPRSIWYVAYPMYALDGACQTCFRFDVLLLVLSIAETSWKVRCVFHMCNHDNTRALFLLTFTNYYFFHCFFFHLFICAIFHYFGGCVAFAG